MSPPVNYVTLIITNITTLVTVDSRGDHFANYCPQITSSLDTTPQKTIDFSRDRNRNCISKSESN